jgi:hypothetical protein
MAILSVITNGGGRQMKIGNNALLGSACLCLAMVFSPAPASAATALAPQACVAGKPTAASYTWDFKAEASSTLKNVEDDARQISYEADQLRSFARDQDVSWGLHERDLSRLGASINDINSNICRLETIRRVVTPKEQKAIDAVISEGTLMSIHAQDAVNYGSDHPGSLFLRPYRADLVNIYNEANALSRSAQSAAGAS